MYSPTQTAGRCWEKAETARAYELVIVTGANGGRRQPSTSSLRTVIVRCLRLTLLEQPIASSVPTGTRSFRQCRRRRVIRLANAVAALDEPITGAGARAAGIAHSQPLLETSFDT